MKDSYEKGKHETELYYKGIIIPKIIQEIQDEIYKIALLYNDKFNENPKDLESLDNIGMLKIAYDIVTNTGNKYALKTETESKPEDVVNHPSHYTDGRIEVIDFIEDKNLNFHKGNAIKYIARSGKKDPRKEKEDLLKAIWYLNRLIERLSDD